MTNLLESTLHSITAIMVLIIIIAVLNNIRKQNTKSPFE